MKDQFSQFSHRVRGYWYIDGLVEIGSGILLMLLSLPFFLRGLAPEGSWLAKVASNGKDIVLIFGVAILGVLLRAAKEKSTYPRTGYMEERRPTAGQTFKVALVAVGAVIVFAALLVVGFLFVPATRQGLFYVLAFLPTVIGIFVTIGLLVVWRRVKVGRFAILAGVSALINLGLAAVSGSYLAAHPIDPAFFMAAATGPMPAVLSDDLAGFIRSGLIGTGILTVSLGLAAVISGLIARGSYLRQNPGSKESEK